MSNIIESEEGEFFTLTYRGRIASEGLLNFYEFGRAQYGAARLLYSAAGLRENGVVPDKITRKIGKNIYVRAPERGSFVVPILLEAGKEAVKIAVDVGILTLLAYTFRQFRDPQKLLDEIIEGARPVRQRAAFYRNIGAESSDRVDRLEQLLSLDEFSYDQMGELAEHAGRLREGASDVSEKDMEVFRNWSRNVLSLKSLDEILERDAGRLGRVSEEQLDRLSYKMRSAAQDMALPLRTSADYVALGAAANDNLFGVYNEEEIEILVETELDDDILELECDIIEYNKEGRFGKLRIVDKNSDLNLQEFYFSTSRKNESTHNSLIDALKLKRVTCRMRAALRAGVISRFLVSAVAV